MNFDSFLTLKEFCDAEVGFIDADPVGTCEGTSCNSQTCCQNKCDLAPNETFICK